MSAKPTQPDPPKKRAPAKPSDETLALRALRETRKLRERAVAAQEAYEKTRAECVESSAAIIAGLPAGARAIFDKLSPETVTGKAAE